MELPELLGCVVYDKIIKQHLAFTFVNSKEEYIRSMVENLIQSQKNLNDLQPKIICKYDVTTGVITPMNEEFGFDCYKMPMTKAEALAPLGVDFANEALEFEQWKREKAEKAEKAKKN